jgi:uncharacterized membrane protein
MAENPYAPPRSHVEDVEPMLPDGDFVADGRAVPAGSGWRWLADAWAFTGAQRATFIGVTLLLVLGWIVVSFVPFVGPLGLALVYPLLSAGLLIGCDAVRSGERLEVGHLFAGFQHPHSARLLALGALSIAASIVFGIIMVAITGASLGLVMLGGGQPAPEQIVPFATTILLALLVVTALSIPWVMAVWFAVPLIVFNGVEVVAALKTSFFACLKNIVPFLVWGVAVLVLSIVATIPLLLGWLLLAPMLWASMYLIYRDVFYDI